MHEYTLYLGADHRGFEKKNELAKTLPNCHPGMIKVQDCGADEYIQDDDFNEPAKAVAKAVSANEHSMGILLCGSGQGVCIQANRIHGARAVCAKTPEEAVLGREHDWANVVCLSADTLTVEEMLAIIKAFCHAKPLDTERHSRRMRKLEED